MKITCRQKEGEKDFFTIFVDDIEWKDIHKAIFGYNPKIITEILSKCEIETDFSSFEFKQIKKYIFRRLSKRNYSSFELQKLLKDRKCSNENSLKAIEEVQSLGIIKDLEWMEIFVKNQIERKVGPKMIAFKLKNKNVPKEFIDENLQRFVSVDRKIDAIERLINIRYQRLDLNDYHQRNKVIAAILRKGFDLEDIFKVLDQKQK